MNRFITPMVRLYRSITMLLFNNFCDILLNSKGYEPPTCSDNEEEMVDEEEDKKSFNCEHQRPITKEGENIPTAVGYYQSAYFPGVSMHLAQILKCPASLPTKLSDDPLTGTSRGNRNKCYASGILYRVKYFIEAVGAGLGGSFQGFMKKGY
ncbi:hypothetical protein Tco_0974376 [Tanacetum coccineum]|uniref:Uncharacterized protein n=1 Tax=Tanacetum coccineum TaxID=301880 RepID=A0ABQ5EBF2_9ASTR